MNAARLRPWRGAFCLAGMLAAGHVAAQSSGLASNITQADTRSNIAPRLPAPPVPRDAGPRQYLVDARMALREGRTGAAQEALERAETRVLNGGDPGGAAAPVQSAMLQAAAGARQALGAHDVARAGSILDAALALHVPGAGPPPGAPPPPLEAELAYPPQAGAWSWHGDHWVWAHGHADQAVAPQWVPAHWAWQGSWVMAPGHWR